MNGALRPHVRDEHAGGVGPLLRATGEGLPAERPHRDGRPPLGQRVGPGTRDGPGRARDRRRSHVREPPGPTRLIAHYAQPHVPYVGRTRILPWEDDADVADEGMCQLLAEDRARPTQRIYDRIRSGDISRRSSGRPTRTTSPTRSRRSSDSSSASTVRSSSPAATASTSGNGVSTSTSGTRSSSVRSRGSRSPTTGPAGARSNPSTPTGIRTPSGSASRPRRQGTAGEPGIRGVTPFVPSAFSVRPGTPRRGPRPRRGRTPAGGRRRPRGRTARTGRA